MNADVAGDDRAVRAAQNQSLFREVNERMRELGDAFAEDPSPRETFVCECADVHCNEPIEMTPREYEAVRGSSNRFAVRRGHVLPDVERVVAESDGYVVVEKFAAGTANELDPRS